MDDKAKIKMESAHEQGKAFTEALSIMQSMDQYTQDKVGDYIITVATEQAEGAYELDNEEGLIWKVPDPAMNQHVEVVVQDNDDLRFLPSLEVSCKITSQEGALIGEQQHPFIWHPFLYHYGTNWEIPQEGDYFIEVTVKRPQFLRHDEERGNRYIRDEVIKLGPLHLIPGRKPHGPE